MVTISLSHKCGPGGFAFAPDYLINNEHDATTIEAQFKNGAIQPAPFRHSI